MPITSFYRRASVVIIAMISCFVLTVVANSDSALAQQAPAVETVVVSSEGIPSAYGAPPGISRTRFSPLLTAYVLPPWTFFVGELYQGDIFRHGPPEHIFTQEVEMGLPYRLGVAVEGAFDRFNGGGGPRSASVEARYALADYNKIPLNPTVFAEYKFGTGPIRREELMMPPAELEEEEEGEEEEGGPPERPDAYEFRLLLAQDFGEHLEWAMNWFFEQEVTGDEGREWGFAQSAVTPVLLPEERLKVGVEMQYKNFTTKFTRDEAENSFVVGPTVAWKPSRNTRFDVSTLFGCTDESPRVQVFGIFSLLLGPAGAAEAEAEAPVSTRNR
jgi:hypothetical protein